MKKQYTFFGNLSRKFEFHWYLTRVTGTLHEKTVHIFWKFVKKIRVSLISYRNNRYLTWKNSAHFLSYLAHFFLELETFQTGKVKTQFTFNNFPFENGAVYEIMWNNTVEWGRTQIKIRHIRITDWILKATNSHS